jgi:predicted TIM-barrel fold metal-dependent hydrolase
MSINGWLVADSDMHIMEPPDLWQRYSDPDWAHLLPVGMDETERDMRVKMKSVIQPNRGASARPGRPWKDEVQQDSALTHADERHWDAKSQVMAMEMEHLDSTVLFPSRGLFAISLPSSEHIGPKGLEPGLATAIARGYNDWLADYVADCQLPDRVFGAAMLAPHDVGAAVDELARMVERGFKAAFLSPGLADSRPWHHPVYDPLWREAVRLNVPVCFHGGGVTQPDFSFGEHLDRMMLWHPFNQPLGIMFAATCLTSGGILERFPELRVGLLEGNCSWAPFMMYRLDEHWEWTGKYEAPELQRKPSEYLVSNCFLSCEADEETAKYYFDFFGDDNVVYSTDYPHADSKFPFATESFLELPFAESTKQKVLWDNYAKLYDLEPPSEPSNGAG